MESKTTHDAYVQQAIMTYTLSQRFPIKYIEHFLLGHSFKIFIKKIINSTLFYTTLFDR